MNLNLQNMLCYSGGQNCDQFGVLIVAQRFLCQFTFFCNGFCVSLHFCATVSVSVYIFVQRFLCQFTFLCNGFVSVYIFVQRFLCQFPFLCNGFCVNLHFCATVSVSVYIFVQRFLCQFTFLCNEFCVSLHFFKLHRVRTRFPIKLTYELFIF